MTKDEIIEAIYKSIDEISEQNSSNIIKNPGTELFGLNSELDSLGLVHMITSVEEKLEEATGNYVAIADERAMSLEHSPFKTVDSLANYIDSLVNAGK